LKIDQELKKIIIMQFDNAIRICWTKSNFFGSELFILH